MKTDEALIQPNTLQTLIHTLRGVPVMIDRDLAKLYRIETRTLKQTVKRNKKRFPDDFMFVLNKLEIELLVSQSVIPSKKILGGSMPFAFTEQGVATLATILTSSFAIEIHIAIMRAFVEMRRYIAGNGGLIQRMDTLEKRQITHEIKTDARFDQIFDALENKSLSRSQGIFFEGQIFDAYVFINNLMRQAKHSIVLIDNFIDDSVLIQLAKRPANVTATILTKTITSQLSQDLKKHNEQYPPIAAYEFPHSHDRFLIIDHNVIYHIGASLKDPH